MTQNVELKSLRPTQMTLGYAEVMLKRQHWREMNDDQRHDFIHTNALPVVLGRKDHHFLIDHHHLARAMRDEGAKHAPIKVVADFTELRKDEFWVVMDHRHWVHAYDEHGRRRSLKSLPNTLEAMVDDPFRSLAAAVRMAGGFQKEPTPFAEFMWADFYRHRINARLLRSDPSAALTQALHLAHQSVAMHLPGWLKQAPKTAGANR